MRPTHRRGRMTDDIRTIEYEVVDQYHRSLRVWRRPQSAIIRGVLRHLGQMPRDFWPPGVPDASLLNLWWVFNEFMRAAAQAVRWAHEPEIGNSEVGVVFSVDADVFSVDF